MTFYENEVEIPSHSGHTVSTHLYCDACAAPSLTDGPRVLTHTEVAPYEDDRCECCHRTQGEGLVRPACHHDWLWDLAAEQHLNVA